MGIQCSIKHDLLLMNHAGGYFFSPIIARQSFFCSTRASRTLMSLSMIAKASMWPSAP